MYPVKLRPILLLKMLTLRIKCNDVLEIYEIKCYKINFVGLYNHVELVNNAINSS